MLRTEILETLGGWFEKAEPTPQLMASLLPRAGRLGPLSGKRKSERRYIRYRWFCGCAMTVKRKKTGSRETLAGRSGLTSFTPPTFLMGKLRLRECQCGYQVS